MAKLREREGVKQHSGLTDGMTHLILKWKDFKWKKGLRNEVQRFSCLSDMILTQFTDRKVKS